MRTLTTQRRYDLTLPRSDVLALLFSFFIRELELFILVTYVFPHFYYYILMTHVQALMEKDQSLMDYQETVEILQVKVRKLEQLVKLKDRRVEGMIPRPSYLVTL